MFKDIMIQGINFRRYLEAVKRITALNNRHISSNCKTFICSPDVKVAKRNGLPIVALESTIITHGMPYPDNLKTAIQVENIVRKKVKILQIIGKKNKQLVTLFISF